MKTKQKEIKQYSIEDLIKDIDFVTIDVYNYLNEDIPKTLLKDYFIRGYEYNKGLVSNITTKSSC